MNHQEEHWKKRAEEAEAKLAAQSIVHVDGAFVGTSVVIAGVLGIVDKAQLRDLKAGQSVVVTIPLKRLYVRAEGELNALEVEVTGSGLSKGENGRELMLTVKR